MRHPHRNQRRRKDSRRDVGRTGVNGSFRDEALARSHQHASVIGLPRASASRWPDRSTRGTSLIFPAFHRRQLRRRRLSYLTPASGANAPELFHKIGATCELRGEGGVKIVNLRIAPPSEAPHETQPIFLLRHAPRILSEGHGFMRRLPPRPAKGLLCRDSSSPSPSRRRLPWPTCWRGCAPVQTTRGSHPAANCCG